MPFGYIGRVLRVDLSSERVWIESPEENFYRRYFGGVGFIGYYLLKELPVGVDPLGPENKLVFAVGVVTGAPFAGNSRISIGAKSPLTGAFASSAALVSALAFFLLLSAAAARCSSFLTKEDS